MPTTIQVSDDIRATLERMKMYEKESYNDILERMLEDQKELNQKTKQEIEEARKRVKSGKFVTMDAVAKKYGV
jgi:predicted CopG family antitoxin